MNWVKKCKLPAIEAIKFWMKFHHINMQWLSFSKAKFIDAINKYSNLSTLDSDYIFWSHLKVLVNNDKCIANNVNIANLYIDLGH